jgi:dihydromethanopterin reductase (acceptor)
MNVPVLPQRVAWAITGSGHYVTECLDLMTRVPALDLFVTRAAHEVVRMYKHKLDQLPAGVRIYKDTTASAAPVGMFYATSNTVAKCVCGISDTLATNVFAQAGKCRVPAIVFACDTAPEMETRAPAGIVKVYPRRIDLENVDRLRSFEATTIVESLEDLGKALETRLSCLNASSS